MNALQVESANSHEVHESVYPMEKLLALKLAFTIFMAMN